jgi:MSHA pilin protein MshD
MPSRLRSTGVTLVELIISIVVIGVALAGVLLVIVRNTQASADPMIWHQAVAIAEAYLEEILTKEFADPGGPPIEGRATYDNVADYNGLTDNGARDQTNTPIAGLEAYTVNVQVVAVAAGELPGVAPADALRVQVTVTPPHGGAITISGYRTNY